MYSRNELFELQPALAKAHKQNKIQVKEEHPVVSIVKGMTFLLIELESVEALSYASLAGRPAEVDGLDEDWNDTFIGTYFYVRTGKSLTGATTMQTRMIEGSLEDPATGSAASALVAYFSLAEGKAGETLNFEITQGVEMGRRSEIFLDVVLSGDQTISKLYLEGGAVAVMEGKLTI